MCNNWKKRNLLVILNVRSNVSALMYDTGMSELIGQHHLKTVMITNASPITRKDLAGTSLQHQ